MWDRTCCDTGAPGNFYGFVDDAKIASARRTRATALHTDCGVMPVARAASAGRTPSTRTRRAAFWAAPPRMRMRRARASNLCGVITSCYYTLPRCHFSGQTVMRYFVICASSGSAYPISRSRSMTACISVRESRSSCAVVDWTECSPPLHMMRYPRARRVRVAAAFEARSRGIGGVV